MKKICAKLQRKENVNRNIKNKKFCVSGAEAAVEDKLILRYKNDFINHYSSTMFEKIVQSQKLVARRILGPHQKEGLKLKNNTDDGRGNDHENRMEIFFLHNQIDNQSENNGFII